MVYSFNLEHKVVLITGGYGYLGKAVVESLLHHNAIVYVLGRSSKSFEDTFQNLSKDKLSFSFCDIENEESIKKCFQNIYEKENRIDVLINNAFYIKGQSPEDMDLIDFNYGIDGVLSSVFRCLKHIIPYYKLQGWGKIINVASMYGVVAPQFDAYEDFPQFLNPPHYGASKAAVIQLTKYYASYLGKHNIHVNTVTPGPFPSTKVQESANFISELSKRTCLNRIGKPEDLAGAFIFLSSDSSNYITGQNIVVDGGWTTK